MSVHAHALLPSPSGGRCGFLLGAGAGLGHPSVPSAWAGRWLAFMPLGYRARCSSVWRGLPPQLCRARPGKSPASEFVSLSRKWRCDCLPLGDVWPSVMVTSLLTIPEPSPPPPPIIMFPGPRWASSGLRMGRASWAGPGVGQPLLGHPWLPVVSLGTPAGRRPGQALGSRS